MASYTTKSQQTLALRSSVPVPVPSDLPSRPISILIKIVNGTGLKSRCPFISHLSPVPFPYFTTVKWDFTTVKWEGRGNGRGREIAFISRGTGRGREVGRDADGTDERSAVDVYRARFDQ